MILRAKTCTSVMKTHIQVYFLFSLEDHLPYFSNEQQLLRACLCAKHGLNKLYHTSVQMVFNLVRILKNKFSNSQPTQGCRHFEDISPIKLRRKVQNFAICFFGVVSGIPGTIVIVYCRVSPCCDFIPFAAILDTLSNDQKPPSWICFFRFRLETCAFQMKNK